MIRTYYKDSSGMYNHMGDCVLDKLEALKVVKNLNTILHDK